MLLGQAAALGVDPSRLLRADDVERALLLDAVHESHRYHDQRDRALARMIISELGEAVKRGRK